MPDTPLPHVHDTGSGPPLLFLHAFPLDASQWDHQVAAFSDRYRCLRPDAYGCAASPAPPPGMTLDTVASGVLGALDRLGVEDFAVVGLSMGGYTAFALWRQAASRIRAVALCDTRPDPDSEQGRADRLAMADRVRREGVQVIVEPMVERLLAPQNRGEFHVSDPVRGRIRRWTPEGVAACQEAMAGRPDSTPMLASISVPSLVVVGSEDAVSPPAVMRAMADAMPSARVVEIEGAGHLTNLERWEAFDAALASFLDESYPATAR